MASWRLLGFLMLALASGGTAVQKRPFALMTLEQATKLMEDGYLDVKHLPKAQDMAMRIVSSVNNAVVQIRNALISNGTIDEADVPLSGNESLKHTAPEAEAVTWGFAQIPGVTKLALVGGVCGGKSKSKHLIRDALQKTLKLRAFATPEIATVLFLQGGMSNGTFENFVPEEYDEFMVQSEILQIVFEGIWSQGAALSAKGQAAILLTDRDAVDGKSYSRPMVPSKPISWSRILLSSGKLMKIPGLSDDDLVKRYLGAVFWHSTANANGTLAAAAYRRFCYKPTRHETAQDAYDNDVVAAKVYAKAYPTDAVLWLESLHTGPLAPKIKRIIGFVEGRFKASPPSQLELASPQVGAQALGLMAVATPAALAAALAAAMARARPRSGHLREPLVSRE